MITIALADDHVLLRKGLASLVQNLGYSVLFEADHGQELVDKIQTGADPDLVLMDINMPVKDGYETTRWIRENKPLVKVLALSMYDDESAVIRMLKSGARGYILKDAEPAELKAALDAVIQKGFYYSEMVTGRLVHSVAGDDDKNGTNKLLNLTDRETAFLKLACTELSYKEIASEMHLSPRTIDGYRDALFEKLCLKTRTGLVVYAIRHGIYQL
ncbi:MAG: response regulator transcription factor [Chitinophagaceae bacterium]|nr:response regulator transcription factor [Chitinophagaceae bacterium]MBP6588463.1 response regulator transcription factor [Chitinophagaceae bacterium]